MAPRAPTRSLCALLVLVAATLAAAPLQPTSSIAAREPPSQPAPDPKLAEAQALHLAGDYEAAAQRYRQLAEQLSPALARQAWLGASESLRAAGDASGAAEALERVIALGPADRMRGRALVRLAHLRRLQGDCRSALSLLHEAEPLLRLGPYLPLQRAACHAALDEPAQVAAAAMLALRQATTRPARVDALEQLAHASLQLDDREAAARWLAELLQAASTESYRAETRYRLARLQRELGRESEAVHHFRTLVVDQPAQPWAARALWALQEMGREAVVSYAQAGQVHLYQGRYADARAAFDAYLAFEPDGPEAVQARYFSAVARLRQGEEQAATDALVSLALDAPHAGLAPVALLRAGRVLESNGHFGQAANAFQRLASAHPDSSLASEARFRLGFVQWLRGQQRAAIAVWRALAEDEQASAAQRAQAHLWLGLVLDRRAATGDGSESGLRSTVLNHWRQASALDPDHYPGLRAASLLARAETARWRLQLGERVFSLLVLSRAPVALSVEGWYQSRGLDWAAVQAEIQAQPAFVLAEELLAVGLTAEASRELFALADALRSSPERLFALSALLAEPTTQHFSLIFASRAASALAVPPSQLPRALQRLVYPLPYQSLLEAQAERFGIDPLLLAALVRQESSFNPAARSSAGALGLTQVMPQTGRLIAQALGVASFETTDLLRPSVSLEFGASYLADRLASFEGRLPHALAAYNAGEGRVRSWLEQYGDEDTNLFAERIPFRETHYFVRVVYENYHHYRRLYQ